MERAAQTGERGLLRAILVVSVSYCLEFISSLFLGFQIWLPYLLMILCPWSIALKVILRQKRDEQEVGAMRSLFLSSQSLYWTMTESGSVQFSRTYQRLLMPLDLGWVRLGTHLVPNGDWIHFRVLMKPVVMGVQALC